MVVFISLVFYQLLFVFSVFPILAVCRSVRVHREIYCVCSLSPWFSPAGGAFGWFLDFDAANSSWLLRSPLTYFRKLAFCSVGSSVWVSRRLQSLVQCPLMCQLLHTNSPFSLTESFEHFFRLLKWVSQWYFSPL